VKVHKMAKEKSGDNFSFCSYWAKKKTHFPPQPGSETSTFDSKLLTF